MKAVFLQLITSLLFAFCTAIPLNEARSLDSIAKRPYHIKREASANANPAALPVADAQSRNLRQRGMEADAMDMDNAMDMNAAMAMNDMREAEMRHPRDAMEMDHAMEMHRAMGMDRAMDMNSAMEMDDAMAMGSSAMNKRTPAEMSEAMDMSNAGAAMDELSPIRKPQINP